MLTSKLGQIALLAVMAAPPAVLADHDPPPLADPIPAPIADGPFSLEFVAIADGLVFPTFVRALADGSGRLLIAERGGVIRLLKNGSIQPTPFLDISATTVSNGGSALASIALHPGFAVPGDPGEGLLYTCSQEAPGSGTAHFPAFNSVKHQSVVYEWRVSAADPDVVDPVSRREILRVDEGATSHNINDLAFGADGYLYILKGDDDMGLGIARDGSHVHGSILRIDVDDSSGNGRYSIPADNPFVAPGDARLDEIYAHGFRNPWRFAFNPLNDELLAGDVGEDDIEEIDVIVPGAHYGWTQKEGSFAFLGFNVGVTDDLSDLPPGFAGIDPVAQYDHTEGDASITGGIVYRGSAFPELIGHYVFGDFVSSRLMHLDPVSGLILELPYTAVGTPGNARMMGFGETGDGELLMVLTEPNLQPTGRLLQLVNGVADDVDTDGDGLLNSVDSDDDADGMADADEIGAGSNPLLFDTDGDGFGDGMEDASGHDPLYAGDAPVWGDIDNDRRVDARDVLLAAKSALGLVTLADDSLARCNVAPLVAGVPSADFDGDCDSADLLLINGKALGVRDF